MEDYLTKHKKRQENLQGLYDRNDLDRRFYYQEPYIMYNLKDPPQPVKNVHNITLNDAAVFAHRAIAILASAHQQVVVEGDGIDTIYVEDFINACLWEADQNLIKQGYPSLYPWNCEHVCIRGRLSSRNLIRVENKELKIDVMPWDTRFVTFEFDRKGLDICDYETIRDRADIKAEYGVDVLGKTGKVLDLWTPTHNIISIEGKQHKEEKHKYDENPCIYQRVPSGSMLQDELAEEHRGESIFSLDRGMFLNLNKAASILMTQNMQSFEAGLQLHSDAGSGAELPDEDPRAPGQMTAVEKGGGFTAIPTNDMKMATRYLLQMLEARAQRGALSNIDYGNLSFPLSAVAIAKLSESKDQIFVPRLMALSLYYQQLAKLFIRQFIKYGKSAELGEEAHRKSFDPSKLKGSYTIKFRYFSQSPEQEIANYSVAVAAMAFLSEDTIRKDILKLRDPDGEKLKKNAEKAAVLDPDPVLYDTIIGLYNEDNTMSDIKADMLKPTLLNRLRQKMSPVPQAPPVQEGKGAQPPEGLVPLMGGGGGAVRRPVGRGELEPSEEFVRDEEERAGAATANRERRAIEGENV